MLSLLRRASLLALALAGPLACTLDHATLPTGTDVNVQDNQPPVDESVAQDGGTDIVEPLDVVDDDVVVAAMDVVDVPVGMDVVDVPVAPDVVDVVAPMDVQDIQDVPVATDTAPDDVPAPTDVPVVVQPGHACVMGVSVCAAGTECFAFTGGGVSTPATVCAYCGQAGQRPCTSTGCNGLPLETDRDVCARSDVDTHCGGPGGTCFMRIGGTNCNDCAGGLQCLSSMTDPNVCLSCGDIGQPCCCHYDAASHTDVCDCAHGSCSRGGSSMYTVCATDASVPRGG